ncbi:MAG: hypothetical protein ABR552_09235 [Actinomycetota bacterium]|nr:hypothetical protein [Actinomycetota bacterium]
MRRAVFAILAGLVIFATVYAFAASLTVTGGSLGAGNVAVAACQSGTINVTYTPSYSSSVPGYQATTVTLNNVDTASSACGGKSYRIALVDNSSASLGEATGTVPSSGTTVSATFSGVNATSVYGVHVAISG